MDLSQLFLNPDTERRDLIALRWQQGLAQIGFSPLDALAVRQRLAEQFDRLLALLAAEPFDPVPARAVGAELVRLNYTHPDSLGVTHSFLVSELAQAVPGHVLLAMRPRLTALLGQITAGFVAQVQSDMLSGQEKVRQALIAEREQAYALVRQTNENLERLVAERTAALQVVNRELEQKIIERKCAEQALRASQQRLELALEGGQADSWEMNLVTGELCYTPRWAAFLGYAPEDIAPTMEAIETLVHPDDRARNWQSINDYLNGLAPAYHTECRLRNKAGEWVWVMSRGKAVEWDMAGRPVRLIGTSFDISERKRVEESLRQQTLELEARNQDLDAFAHMAAHDLKNPLATVTSFVEVLSRDLDHMTRAEQQWAAQSIGRSVHKMNNIVDELLLLASVRQTRVKSCALDMWMIVDQVRLRMWEMVQERQAEIVLPAATDWPTALGHAPWVEEVWVNYLSNALKYGEPPIRIELGANIQADGMARFWVRDNGPGIAPEDQARLFIPFSRLKKTLAQGHGLGLSIVRRIIEKLDGRVGVESVPPPGRGNVFYFTLPLAAKHMPET